MPDIIKIEHGMVGAEDGTKEKGWSKGAAGNALRDWQVSLLETRLNLH